MSEAQVTSAGIVGAGGSARAQGNGARAAIARAAQATGVDFQYLMAQARLESSLDPGAHADTSSAAGLFQFTNGTWLNTLGRHAADHGMAWVQQAISGGGLSDPGTRAQIMGLRYDADASALMAAELANDNRADLTARLGREPDSAELYLAHFLGSAGAGQFLSALAADPSQSAASILPAAAAANRSIFFQNGAGGSSPRSLGGVMDLMRAKMAGAMEGGFDGEGWDGAPAYASTYASGAAQAPSGPIARAFREAAAEAGAQSAPRTSMAETLRGMFNAAGSSAPAHVRDAYARLAGLGL
ncbi:lytic transglycosylase domain-containing protein [Novosphingobium aerophilum]|uniref:lytic transglycosylase domain-containing protein n=1 Tax=Novosphingobium TaxID=165696 RepID=UPI0017C726AE|nr:MULTISPECIES: lytic transglycosylase domain-containing protein [unclassified Novosphingobium]WRT93696.1 lytic transglycosylase domain-containing protein [Novosphingobium sp. RL4]